MRVRGLSTSAVVITLLAVGATGALVRAAGLTTRYEAEMQRLRSAWKAAQQAEGLDPVRGAKALYAKYPTPEITLCKPLVVAPGGSAPVSLTGRFPAGTTFLVDHDQITLAPGQMTAARYSATAAVAADALPGFARLFAYAPVSGAWNRCGVVVIGAAPAFSLTASNGWTIGLAPASKTWTINGSSATMAYKAEYFKAGTATPFETTTGSLTVSADEGPDTTYTFSMQPGAVGTAMEEYQALASRMSDPQAFMKMTPKEQAAFQKQLEEVGDRMAKEMEAMTANPAALQERQAQFGCGSLTLAIEGSRVSGNVGCGQKVGSLTLQGTRK